MTNKTSPKIAILGASGLIGEAIATALIAEGFPTLAVAKRFTNSQKHRFGPSALLSPVVSMSADALSELLAANNVDIVINCVGILQDGANGGTKDVHTDFVNRLLSALSKQKKQALLVHLSVPGDAEDDKTAFSKTKRAAEHQIADSDVPHVILRPGFVIAPRAYGGSALIRAIAALPFGLSAREAQQEFATAAISDIARTVSIVATRWRDGTKKWNSVWDIMSPTVPTVGFVIDRFRQHLGGPNPKFSLPSLLLSLGAKMGDLVGLLGWAPPVRTTALAEMRRGVAGDPSSWIAETGITPLSFTETLAQLPATIQEKWFARLFLLKPLILAMLAGFWFLSGAIALAFSFQATSAVFTSHGFPPSIADILAVVTSLADIAVAIAIAFRRTCKTGLIFSIAISFIYMTSAAFLAPDLWLDPLGAMVKVGPSIVLTLVGIAILDDRA